MVQHHRRRWGDDPDSLNRQLDVATDAVAYEQRRVREAREHLVAVLADNGNCTSDEPQDPSCPRCRARAFLATIQGSLQIERFDIM